MKRFITLSLLMLLISATMLNVAAYAANDEYIAGKIIVDGVELDGETDVYFSKENDIVVWISLRSLFEGIGAEVTWDSDTNSITIEYNNCLYLCEFKAPNDRFPDNVYIYIKEVKSGKYLYLTPMSLGGAYKTIDDRVYISWQTMGRLLYQLKINLDVDSENHLIRVAYWN